ncbi:MAG: hypothetical protein WAX07_07530 [Candidatus Altiarchaeia archaeon]
MDSILSEKGQSALDLLLSYGWIVVVAAVAIILVSQTGIYQPLKCEKTQYGFSQVQILDYNLFANNDKMAFLLQNWAGETVRINAVDLKLGDNVECRGTEQSVIEPGGKLLMIIDCAGPFDEYPPGVCFTADIKIDYSNLQSGYSDESIGKIRGAIERTQVTTTTTTISSTTTTQNTPPRVRLNDPLNNAVL